MTKLCPVRRIRKTFRRGGAVLIAALVCLLIVTTMLGSMLQGTLRIRRHLHAQRNLRQTELMLQAGADRAAFRLATEPTYQGEKWVLPAEAIVGKGDGLVTVEIARDSTEAPWRVHVVAQYPAGNELSIRRSHSFLFQPPMTQSEE